MADSNYELTGSVQVKDDRYYIVVNIYIEGRRSPKWIPTELSSKIKANERKAERLLYKYIDEYSQKPEYLPPSKKKALLKELGETDKSVDPLFTEFIKKWLNDKDVDVMTWESYETYVYKHIIPYFEPLMLSVCQVKSKHVKDYYDHKAKGGRMDKKEGGLSTKSIKKHASVLKMAFDYALILVDDLVVNPVIGVPITKGQDTEFNHHVCLSAAEANNLLDAATGHELKALIYIALYYGLRRSELVGLKWSAIDFEAETIEINFTVVKNRTIVEKARMKNKRSKAKFVLLDDVKNVLLQIQKQTEANRAAFGNQYSESDFVFVKPNGVRYDPDAVYRKFKALLRKQKLPDMRLHDLRHSCASILYDKGWDMKAIQTWMRHSDSSMTSYYTHLSEMKMIIKSQEIDKTFRYEASDTISPSENVYIREKLYQQVWENPVTHVAEHYGVSSKMIYKYCDKMNIPVPPNGYWAKLRANIPVKVPPLPEYEGITVIKGRRTRPMEQD